MDEWDARCDPPWTDGDLYHKFRDARGRVVEVAATSVPVTTPVPPTPLTATSPTPDANGAGNGDITVVENAAVDEWPTLDADARHGIAGDLLGTLEPHTEADSAGLLLTFLVAFGSLVGRKAYVYAGGDCHHANLYATLVGASSRARKGTSLGFILGVFSGLDTGWSDRRVNGLSSGEGVVAAVQDILDDDGKLVTVDKRLFVVETEFGVTLRVLKREQNTLSGVLRNGWDRGELGVLTRTAPLRATDAHISILGHITRDELIRYLSDVDVFNGFANRFLWGLVQRSKMLPEASPPRLDDLRRRLTVVYQTATKIGEVKRSPSASAIWCESYPALVAEKRGLWDAVTSRAEAQVLRLSLVYALLDGSDTIDVPHLRAALAIWRYCDDSARLIFSTDDQADTGGTLEARIRQLARERPGIMRTELRDAISHKIKANELERALTWLAGRGEIQRRTSTESGRVCERIHPADANKPTAAAVITTGSASSPPTASIDDLVPAIVVAPTAPNAPPPQRPAAPEMNAEGDKGTKALTETEFFAEIPQSPLVTARAATLTELLNWRNANGASFTRRADGVVWVTNEDRLTPTIRAAIDANQDTLASLVPVEQSGQRNGDCSPCSILREPSKEEMRERYRRCLADVIPAKYENGVIVNWDEMTEKYRKDDPPLTDEFRALFELPKNASTDKEAEFLGLAGCHRRGVISGNALRACRPSSGAWAFTSRCSTAQRPRPRERETPAGAFPQA